MPALDDTSARFALLDMDPMTPALAPRMAPTPAPAPTPASPLDQGRALLAGADSLAALDTASHGVAALCERAGIGKTHPTRAALRDWYRLATLAIVWRLMWAQFARGVESRPSLVTRPMVPDASGTLLGALGAVADESVANAAITSAGSLAGGQLAGVGFTSAAGYETALRNGVKRATADSYLATLRDRYGYTPERVAALVVTIIPEASDLPVGEGITHMPTGPDIFAQRRAEREAATAEIRRTADAAHAALGQRFTVSDASPTAWWAIGWRGAGHITRAELITACGEAPDPKVPSTQLGRTMDSLKGTHDCSRVESGLPAGVKVRWQIGRGRQHQAFVGAEYGRVLAIVDLDSAGALTWQGDAAICDEVRAEYTRLCGDEVLRAGDVTTWLSRLLTLRYRAVTDGHDYLVGPERRDAARAFFGQVARVWGAAWKRGGLDEHGAPVLGRLTDDLASILGGIYQGLSEAIEECEGLWATTVETAKGKPIGTRACMTALARLDGPPDQPREGVSSRVDDVAPILGAGPHGKLRARVAALRAKINQALDVASDGSARTAYLELT